MWERLAIPRRHRTDAQFCLRMVLHAIAFYWLVAVILLSFFEAHGTWNSLIERLAMQSVIASTIIAPCITALTRHLKLWFEFPVTYGVGTLACIWFGYLVYEPLLVAYAPGFLLVVPFAAVIILSTIVGFSVPRRPANAHQCPECGYDRRGLDNRPCPECGNNAVPDRSTTTEHDSVGS
ncbi:MAG: hypothetical protein AAF432_12490 [Planctomycetota bacterium]